MNLRLLLLCLASAFLLADLVSCSKELRTMNKYGTKGSIAQKDTAAMFFMNRKDYDKAAIILEEIVPLTATTQRGEDLLRNLALAKYNTGEYIMATYYFDQYLKRFPASKFTEEAAFLQAYAYFKQSDPYFLDQIYSDKAAESLQNFINAYPQSSHAKEVNEYLNELRERKATKAFEGAKLYFNLSNYKSSVYAFQSFMQEFPDSRYRQEAHFLMVKSAVLLAKQSTDAKKENRYKDAIEYYQKFIDKYPGSIYRKEAEGLYDEAKRGLELFLKDKKVQ